MKLTSNELEKLVEDYKIYICNALIENGIDEEVEIEIENNFNYFEKDGYKDENRPEVMEYLKIYETIQKHTCIGIENFIFTFDIDYENLKKELGDIEDIEKSIEGFKDYVCSYTFNDGRLNDMENENDEDSVFNSVYETIQKHTNININIYNTITFEIDYEELQKDIAELEKKQTALY